MPPKLNAVNADWLIGVERWRKKLPSALRVFVNMLLGLAVLGLCIGGWYLLVRLIFVSDNPAIGLAWFAVVILVLFFLAQYHDRRRRRH